ncbi:MAG: histidine phosphatase family protein [Lewinellaceae bacterium]|nr:histidine phosphatase family protein [Saprospiraceae bacterium]MCB9330993.1 histidine phosphatase family protein [Lewinellaceae bacterium]
MKTLSLLLIATAIMLSACTTRYYIVRHAERLNNSADSPLSTTGETRANILRDSLSDKGISTVFASTYQRTQQTAQPLATALSLSLILYKPDTTAGLIARLDKMRGKNVLVVGHSNTVPELVYGLSQQAVSPIPETDYDNLYIVKVSRGWGRTRRTLVHTTYGPPSP